MTSFYTIRGTVPGFKWGFGAVTLLFIIFFLRPTVFLEPTTVSPKISIFNSSMHPPLPKPRIPNIVHFVHLLPESEISVLEFSFRQFIAVYSALYHLKPDKIYIHTNSEKQIIDDAKTSTDKYLKLIANLPNVVFNHEVPPNRTTSGLAIENLAHRADFVRTKMLKKHGGIYLDDDAYVLRDMSPLRHMGFDNVLGLQANDEVCNAVLVCAPGNDLIVAYDALEDKIFDGSWSAHSVGLLTTLHADYSALENSVLTLPHDAFFPGSWMTQDLIWMYQVYQDQGPPVAVNHDTRNQSDFIASFQSQHPQTWQHDWRTSYTLHGWTAGFAHFTPEERKKLFGTFDGITLDYVLAQTSNFARAVFPAINHAVMNKVLDLETLGSG